MGTQKDKFFLGVLFHKNILDEFHGALRQIIERRIGTGRIGPRISILGSRMPAATGFVVHLGHNVLVLDIPVVIELRERIAFVVSLSTPLGHGFHRLVGTQEFRSA